MFALIEYQFLILPLHLICCRYRFVHIQRGRVDTGQVDSWFSVRPLSQFSSVEPMQLY